MRGVSHGIQPSPPCLTILSSVKRDHGRPGDLCPGPALGTPVVPLPSSPGQSQGPGGSSARHQKPCSMAGAAQACWCRALLWLSLSPRVSHAHHPLQRFLLQSMSREHRPRAEQTPWGSLHFPRLQGAERGSEGAGGAGLVSHFMPVWLPALFPARFPRQLRFGTFTLLLNLRASLHPLRRISAGADCSLRGLGRVWAGCSPRDHPGTAGGVPPISGHRGGCRGPGGALRSRPAGAAPSTPHRGGSTFAYPPHLICITATQICIDTPPRYPYLAGTVPSRSLIGCRPAGATPPYIRRARAGWRAER